MKAGKVKALAVTSEKRSVPMPAVATVAEQGVPGFSALAWWGFIAPGQTTLAIVKSMYDHLSTALKNSAVREKLTQQGMDIAGGGPGRWTSSCAPRSRAGRRWCPTTGSARGISAVFALTAYHNFRQPSPPAPVVKMSLNVRYRNAPSPFVSFHPCGIWVRLVTFSLPLLPRRCKPRLRSLQPCRARLPARHVLATLQLPIRFRVHCVRSFRATPSAQQEVKC